MWSRHGNLKLNKLPTIWNSDQDETQFRMRFWMGPAVWKKMGFKVPLPRSTKRLVKDFSVNLLKVVIIVKILQKVLHCSNLKGAWKRMQGWCYLAKITTLLKLQIRFEYHMFLKISKVLINSSYMQFTVDSIL